MDIGVIGTGVMGGNLAINIANNNYSVVVYDKNKTSLEKYIQHKTLGKNIIAANSLKDLVDRLKSPRKIMLMVPAGKIVDELIDEIIPLIERGDILIDGGNSNFQDTNKRKAYLDEKGILYIGTGVSGGEEGALKGPSIMPGGNIKAWEEVRPLLQAISAKTDDGTPCCDWVGEDGAGHFVKMVHNGIEYGDMQLICETYQILKDLLNLSYEEMHEVFKTWNEGELESYLIEITRDILKFSENGKPIIENILDTAGQKGTGKWTVISSLDLGVPLTLIGESVFARALSSQKEERVKASKVLSGPKIEFTGDKAQFINDLGNALYVSKVVSYAQGFVLMKAAAKEYGWNLNYGGIALMWRGGCIIRSSFLGKIKEAFEIEPDLDNLLLTTYFKNKIEKYQTSWRNVVSTAVNNGIWIPAFSSALTYFDGYRNFRLPANLLQAQRDYFGAHTYERVDKPRGQFFHTNWL
ncbi:MAG TPA: decarboxylating NADP(+)-dependent phosphogluconate dehydrogenase [Melioribacteraceae bacterium]|nr:decarboxylating NADP(+)-dependent phosphogluconate dehydrogenase [Melioribacteraceae bacterium]